MPCDRIILEGMQFYAYHGGNVEEQALGQPFRVDLEAELDLSLAGRSDNLKDTVSYAHLYRVALEVMEQKPNNLLETLADQIAGRILERFPVTGVRVRVTKMRPPIKGAMVEGAAVEIHRSRE